MRIRFDNFLSVLPSVSCPTPYGHNLTKLVHFSSASIEVTRDGISDNRYIGNYRISVSVDIISVKISDIGKSKISESTIPKNLGLEYR